MTTYLRVSVVVVGCGIFLRSNEARVRENGREGFVRDVSHAFDV